MAPMTVSPLARYLISATDWRTAMLMIGVGAWAILLPTALLIRQLLSRAFNSAPC